MTDGDKRVRCQVHQGALDAVEGSRVDGDDGREVRFSRNRDLFEAVASDLYDAGLPVRITADHVRHLRAGALRRLQRQARTAA